MLFQFDTQTIQDLEIYQKDINGKSIFSVYARTVTTGGREMMNKLFRTPVTDIEFLQSRKEEIDFFYKNNHYLKLSSRSIDFIEHYLDVKRNPLHDNIIDAAYNGVMNVISPDGDYWIIENGINYLVQLFVEFERFIEKISELIIPSTLGNDFEQLIKFLSFRKLRKILDNPPENTRDYGYSAINTLDHFFRLSHKTQLQEIIQIIYKIDVLQTLSGIMKKEGYTLPEYSNGSADCFEVTGSFHPLLTAPVANSFTFDDDFNLCFLTGPNMSGKSTFLKTVGILLYVSHLGFPVPAKKLKTSVFNGLFTTINLSDNINCGYSHYYSEVRRVKEMALKIKTQDKIVIIFDELFRGTNVKDAFDASLAIVSAMAKIKNNLFFISSHILEVAENLDKEKVLFRCFESTLIDEVPVYDYKLKKGISQERIGMTIIRNEKIIDILNEVVENTNAPLKFDPNRCNIS